SACRSVWRRSRLPPTSLPERSGLQSDRSPSSSNCMHAQCTPLGQDLEMVSDKTVHWNAHDARAETAVARGQLGRSETARTDAWRAPPARRGLTSLQTLRVGFSRRGGHARERRMQETRPRGMLTAAELRELVGREEIETVLAVFPDLYGR